MVDVVEQATKELVKNEREGAWQVMAQQIAHEINNPLTPLKLNIQFLTRLLNDPNSINPESTKTDIRQFDYSKLIIWQR